MQIKYVVEGGFDGSGITDLLFMDGNIILMDLKGKQVALKLTPAQSTVLAEQLTAFVKG